MQVTNGYGQDIKRPSSFWQVNMSKLTVLLIALGCASAFLIQDFKYNQTSTQSPVGQHSSVEDSIRDLMTLITEEKRLRFQLEERLNTAENKINKMEQYNIAVSNELEKEKDKVEQLENMYFKVIREMDHNTSANCDCSSFSVKTAMENIMHDMSIVKEEEIRLREDNVELNNTLVSLRVDNIRTLERVKSDLSNMTLMISIKEEGERRLEQEMNLINTTLSDKILDLKGQLKIANASFQLDAIRELKDETIQLNRTLLDTVMSKEWLTKITNSSFDRIQAVSDELEKQKIKVEQLETTCNDLRRQMDNITTNYNMTGRQSVQTEMKYDITQLQEKLTDINRTLMDTVLDTTTQLQLINQSFVSAMGERDGFSVYKPYSNISGHNSALMFQDMIYNETDVYNSTTGVFNCQRPGLYLFVFTAVKTNGINRVYCRFNKNDQLLALSTAVIAEGGSDKFSSGTNSILLRLQVGDEVFITCNRKEFLAWETSFTGILISPVL